MTDHLILLENKLDQLYTDRLAIVGAGRVIDWADYQFRVGALAMIREVGELIKVVRRPELDGTGEIPSILDDIKGV